MHCPDCIVPRATGRTGWLVCLWILQGVGRASRPDLPRVRQMHIDEMDMTSFQDLVALHPAPPADKALLTARANLLQRISPAEVKLPDMCPGGRCQYEASVGGRVVTVAVQRDGNVVRMRELGSRQKDGDESAHMEPPEHHVQGFIDASPDAAWSYLFIPEPDCEEKNLLFRASLVTPEVLNDVQDVETSIDALGSVTQKTRTSQESVKVTENSDGTTAKVEFFGQTHFESELQRTSLKSGCEALGCDAYFSLPRKTTIVDVSTKDFFALLRGDMPAGSCTPVMADKDSGGSASDLVQVTSAGLPGNLPWWAWAGIAFGVGLVSGGLATGVWVLAFGR